MSKRLEELLERIPHWPEAAQEEALLALARIDERVTWERTLSADDQAKLSALRKMVDDSIERGGSYTDEEVEASISAALDARERDRKSA